MGIVFALAPTSLYPEYPSSDPPLAKRPQNAGATKWQHVPVGRYVLPPKICVRLVVTTKCVYTLRTSDISHPSTRACRIAPSYEVFEVCPNNQRTRTRNIYIPPPPRAVWEFGWLVGWLGALGGPFSLQLSHRPPDWITARTCDRLTLCSR